MSSIVISDAGLLNYLILIDCADILETLTGLEITCYESYSAA